MSWARLVPPHTCPHTRFYWSLIVFVTPLCNDLFNCLCHLVNCDFTKAETGHAEDNQEMPNVCWGQMPPLAALNVKPTEQANLLNIQKSKFLKEMRMSPLGPAFPPKSNIYIPKEQIKLLRKLFTRLWLPRKPLTSASLELYGKHSTLGCVFNKMQPDRPFALIGRGNKCPEFFCR